MLVVKQSNLAILRGEQRIVCILCYYAFILRQGRNTMNGKNMSTTSILAAVINPLVCHRRLSCTILIPVFLCGYSFSFRRLRALWFCQFVRGDYRNIAFTSWSNSFSVISWASLCALSVYFVRTFLTLSIFRDYACMLINTQLENVW